MNRTLALFAALAILLSLSESHFLVAPAFAQPIELAYDDGRAEISWSKLEAGVVVAAAVRFSPPRNVSHIVAAKYYIADKPGTFNVLILDSDRKPVHEKPVVPKTTGWFTVDLSKENIFVKGEFYAAMKWTVAEAPWLGADETKPDGRSFSIGTDGTWNTYPEIRNQTGSRRGRDGDFMIRVRVEAAKDTDRDGLYDFEEAILGTDPKNPDTDDDGLNDADEINIHRTDPKLKDTDGDGLSDGEEVQEYRTDPLKADTDADGLSDGDEIKIHGTDPSTKDTDQDGLDDGREVVKGTDPRVSDSDGDGISDGDEVYKQKTDPLKADTDGDGLTDGDEVKIHGTNPLAKDTDRDGVDDGDEIAKGTNPKVDEILSNALLIVAIIALMALIIWRLLRRRKAPLPPTPAPAPTMEPRLQVRELLRTSLRTLRNRVASAPLRNKVAASLLIVGGILLVCVGYLECGGANLYGIPYSYVRVLVDRLFAGAPATLARIGRIALEMYMKTWLLTIAAGCLSIVAGILVITGRVSRGKEVAHYSEIGQIPLIYALFFTYFEKEWEELLSMVLGAGQIDLQIITLPYFIIWTVFVSFEVAVWIATPPTGIRLRPPG